MSAGVCACEQTHARTLSGLFCAETLLKSTQTCFSWSRRGEDVLLVVLAVATSGGGGWGGDTHTCFPNCPGLVSRPETNRRRGCGPAPFIGPHTCVCSSSSLTPAALCLTLEMTDPWQWAPENTTQAPVRHLPANVYVTGLTGVPAF